MIHEDLKMFTLTKQTSLLKFMKTEQSILEKVCDDIAKLNMIN